MAILYIGFILYFMLSLGCATMPDEPPASATATIETVKEVRKGTNLVDGKLRVIESQLTGDGKTSRGAIVKLENGSEATVKVDYRIRWFDKDNRHARRGRVNWNTLEIGPGKTGTMASMAPAPWCPRFEIDTRNSAKQN